MFCYDRLQVTESVHSLKRHISICLNTHSALIESKFRILNEVLNALNIELLRMLPLELSGNRVYPFENNVYKIWKLNSSSIDKNRKVQ